MQTSPRRRAGAVAPRRTVLFSCWLAATAASQEAATEAKPAAPVFVDGQAQVVPEFRDPKAWIRHQLWVETGFDSDGDGKNDRMHVCVTRQKQTDTEGLKVPAVYETSPYFAGTGGTQKEYFWNPEHELGAKPPKRDNQPDIPFRSNQPVLSPTEVGLWVPRGFAVVHSSSPGTGLSTGCPTVGGENEALGPKAVIDWLCGRAKGYTSVDGKDEVTATWCTGKVGMIGTSYNGTLPIAAATTGVEGLEAIIPIAPNTSYYHYYRSNGLVRHPGGYMGEDIDVLFEFIHSGRPEQRDYCNRKVRDELLQKNQDRITGDYNDFWAGRDYLNQLDKYKAPTLMSHAFNDWNVMPEHSVRIYAALKAKGVPCMAFFHQGGHGGPPPNSLTVRWFTRYLYGIDNGVEKDPRGWIVREGDRMSNPTPYPDYPHPDAKPVALYPSAGGQAVGGLGVEHKPGQKTETLLDDASILGAKLAMAAQSPNRLLYASAPLTTDLHLSGTAKLKIKLASSKPAANLSVWVVSLPWTERAKITDNVITRGWADPQNHKSARESAPLVPGKFYELNFDLQPDDQVIAAGERIGLMIFSSDRDFTLWPAPGTELTIDLDATSLELPVVGGAEAFARATQPADKK